MRPRLQHPVRLIARYATLALLTISALAPLAHAQELIPPRTTDRRFPVTIFCPIDLDLQFTANSSTATITFSTNVFYFDEDSQALRWTQQYLDNICVAPHQTYVDNLGPPGSYSSSCYSDGAIPDRFYFQNAGAIPLKELFASDPAASWDLSHGAYWKQTISGPNNPGVETDRTAPGCLGLGQDSATPSLSDVATTSITVSGLTSGQSYDLSGWWNVQDVFIDLNEVFLTVTITGPNSTPVVKRTWGGLKREYR